jgi:hypothetical protein
MSRYRPCPAPLVAAVASLALAVFPVSAPASETLASQPSRPAAADPVDSARLRQRLSAQGFQPDGGFRRRGDNLLTDALRSGGRWRVVVDSRSGEVVGVRFIGPVVDLVRSD